MNQIRPSIVEGHILTLRARYICDAHLESCRVKLNILFLEELL